MKPIKLLMQKLSKFAGLMACCLLLLSCSSGGADSPASVSSSKNITSFSINGVYASIVSTNIALTLPNGTSLNPLIAAFITTGQSVKVGNVTQVSGTTPNNFNSTLTYTVTAADSSIKNYLVTVTAASGTLPDGVTLRQIDGGTAYYSSYTNGAPLDSIYPVGAWMELPISASDVATDVDAGLNVYFNLAGSPGSPGNLRVDYNIIRNGGMLVIAPDTSSNTGVETVGWFGVDEADMTYGPGIDAWRGSAWEATNHTTWGACNPSQEVGGQCGYTVTEWFMNQLPSLGVSDGRLWYNGHGKGVLFWETDNQAALFVNQYTDIACADSYWFTDSDLNEASQGGCRLLPLSYECQHWTRISNAQRKLAANYAYNIQRINALLSTPHSKPIYAYVELGTPGSSGETITPDQIKAAVWHSIIAGARGIIYFNHSFAGAVTYNILYDGATPSSPLYATYKPVRDMVKSVGAQINTLTPVLLAPFADGYVTAAGTVMYMAKYSDNKFYVFAGSGKLGTPPAANQVVTFTLADQHNGSINVFSESRTVTATNGVFTDTFADDNTIHIYEVN